LATLRDPDGDHALVAGDLVCFPEGPEGGHRVVNIGDVPARMVILSTKSRPAVAVFPDSEKVLLFSGGEGDDLIARKADSVGYWDGES
jgi:uncharacterized cupin superfamily protein